MSFSVRCHRCNRWIGESRVPMKVVAVIRAPEDRTLIPGPRDTWRCPSCRWLSVFQPALAEVTDHEPHRVPSWRVLELKTG